MNLLEINAAKLFEILRTDADKGLSREDVEKNRREFSSTVSTPKTLGAVFKSVFTDVMPLLFVFICLLSFRLEGSRGEWFSLFLFAVVYIILKYVAVRYCAKVSKLLNAVSTKCTVIRDGEAQTVDDSQLVPGDIMILGIGDVVPCDAIVLWQSSLRVSEIQLTGNSQPVLKLMQEDVLRGKGVPYYECIIFAGSVVMSGDAKVLVCNTGKDVFDKKNKLTSRSKHARRTKIFEVASFVSKQISLIWILIAFAMFIVGVIRGCNAFSILTLCVTLAVASLHDLVLTLFDLTLSVSTRRLYKKGCILRDMSSLDRMCDISCVIVDDSRYFRADTPKPNTVFVNNKSKKFRGATDSDVRELFEYAVVASVGNENSMTYNGISVEHTLINCAAELGMSQQSLYEKYLLLEKRPFTEENGMSRVTVFKDSKFFIISIGSPSMVLKTCSYIENDGSTLVLEERERRRIRDLSRVIARGNEGVVAIAVKSIEYKEGTDQIINNRGYSFKGYIGLHTSIRADSARAVNVSHKAGADIVLMTNEGLSTSIGFAKSLSILNDDQKVIEAKDLVTLDEGVFRADIKSYKVFVGLNPHMKADIVSYRKDDGDIIAVTASSVDDLSLILNSDVSFCPSDTADEAARQNSDVIIKPSFEIIPECVKCARSVYRNTRHMLQYLLNFQFILLFSFLLPLLYLGKPAITGGSVMTYAVLAVLPLAFSMSVKGLLGNELKDTFGSQNLEINAQNLILIPAICGFVSGAVIALSAKSALLAGITRETVNGCSFITLMSGAVFMAYALSTDDSFDAGVFKNRYLLIFTATTLGLVALFTLVKPLASLIDIAAPTAQRYALSVITGMIPALICVGIKLVKKYIFSNQKN